MDWFVLYGSFDLSLSPLPEQELATEDNEEFIGDSEDEDEATEIALTSNQINLRPFDRNALRTQDTASRNTGKTIQSVYDAGLANSKHRLHDLMVIYIAELCLRRGAKVFDDPNTVDLLVQYENTEFLVEVKSVTSRNLVKRLRYALGQLLQYDYLRSQQVNIPRRKVVALTANVPPTSWCIPFLNNHLDMDLLSLKRQTIQVETNAFLSAKLFGPLDNGPNLNI